MRIGRGNVGQQKSLGLVHVALLAQVEQASGQGQGGALAVLDVIEQAPFGVGGTHVGKDRVHRLGRGLVIGVQPFDSAQMGFQAGAIADQHRIANGNGAVMHTAAEVDGVTLLDRTVVTDVGQGRVDQAHAIDPNQSHQNQQRKYQPKSQSKAFGDCQRAGHSDFLSERNKIDVSRPLDRPSFAVLQGRA